jgi:hypothetical protein
MVSELAADNNVTVNCIIGHNMVLELREYHDIASELSIRSVQEVKMTP